MKIFGLKYIKSFFHKEEEQPLHVQFKKQLKEIGVENLKDVELYTEFGKVVIKHKSDTFYYNEVDKSLHKYIHDTFNLKNVQWFYQNGKLKKNENYRTINKFSELISYTKFHDNGIKSFVMDSDSEHKYYTVYSRTGNRIGHWTDDYNLALYFYGLMLE